MSLVNKVVNMESHKCYDCETKPGDYHLPACSVVRTSLFVSEGARKPEVNVLQKFDTEIATITQRRGDVYGDPTDDFNKAADLMAHFDHIEPKALRHALRMICVKLARITTTPDHLDSYVDIVGYARTAVMVIDRRNKNSIKS